VAKKRGEIASSLTLLAMTEKQIGKESDKEKIGGLSKKWLRRGKNEK
jgi:hypothetical protein